MKVTTWRGLAVAMVLCLPLSALAQQVGSGAVSLAGPGAGASEDFNTLESSGTSSSLPDGWYFQEMGGGSQATYAADNGNNSGGNVYSYGTAADDRAFGILAANAMAGSGSVVAYIGAQLRNDSGAMLNDLLVSYTGEAWRRRSAVASPDRLVFQYSVDATSLTSGTWLAVPALDFVTPSAAPISNTGINGNLPAHQAQLSATLAGLAVPASGTFWIRWSDTNIAGEDDGLAIDNIVFGSLVDVPPTLVSSHPADGTVDFPANGTLTLRFSEPVDVSGTWFEIQCAVSGYRNPATVDVSGGPIEYFLTPATAFEVGETCELTFDTDFVVDQGPSQFPLVDPGTIHFTTVAPPPNVLPTVAGTVPANNASNFPSAGDLKVTFSEPIVAGAGAFTLGCATSTGIVLTPTTSDGGVNFTIDTGTALVAGDACSFTIHAAAIIDLDGGAMAADITIDFTVLDAGNTSAYYEKVNLASPQMLRCSLHETIKGHTMIPYGWTQLEIADEAPPGACTNPSNHILDVYRNRCYQKITARSNPVGPNNYNREHTWPKSLGFNNSSLHAHNDLHMLHLSASDHNSTRDNDPFDNCTGAGCSSFGTDSNNGVGGPGPRGNSNWSNGNVFEVWDVKKGDMARAIFYMAIRYEGIASEDAHDGDIPDLELTDDLSMVKITSNTAAKAYMGKLSTLLDWHVQDAPDERELQRTGIVQSYQGNRNPFIDHPEWVSQALFTSTQPANCVLNLNAPAANDDSYAVAQDGALTVAAAGGVLANDSDAEGAPLSAQVMASASHGSLALVANGGFTYTPNAGFCGADGFTYRASDGTRVSPPATVTIAVGENCGPLPDTIFANGFEN